MFESIEINGFRALKSVCVDLAEFQVLVGPNASGKSTFFDAIAFVRDILIGGLEGAVFGKAQFFQVPMRAADPLDLSWQRRGDPIEMAFTVKIPEHLRAGTQYTALRYEISVDVTGPLRLANENLFLCPEPEDRPKRQLSFDFPHDRSLPSPVHRNTPKHWRKVVSKTDTGNDYFRSEITDWNNMFRLGPAKSALANLPEDEGRFPIAIWFKRALMEGTYRLALNAEAMRVPSRAGSQSTLLPDGSNLPWVVDALEQQNPERFQDWMEHLRTSLPDIAEVRVKEREEDRARYLQVVYRNGLESPSWLLSDGTLRMLALTLLAYAPTFSRIVLIEEPENGIHPQAVESVLQSLQSIYSTQVFLATHSPVVLSQIELKDLLCFAKTREGATDIVRGSEHPALRDWKAAVHLGDLLALGVLG